MEHKYYLVISFYRNSNGERFDSMEIGCESLNEVNQAMDDAFDKYTKLKESFFRFSIVEL